MLIGRHDIDKLMRLEPASASLPNALGHLYIEDTISDAEIIEIESELSELLLSLRPIKQVSIYGGYLCAILSKMCSSSSLLF